MTAPSIVAGHTTQADTSGATTRTINVPTHSAGNVVLLAVVTDASSGTITSPAFADYVFQDRPILTGGGSTVAVATVFWKIAGGSEGSTYTINTSVSERVGAVAFAVTGSNGAIHASTETTGDSGTATVPAITTSAADCLRISIVGADGVTQTTPHGTATNHTKLAEAWASSSGAVSVHYKTIPTATTDSAETSTLAASEQWIGFSIALAPAAGNVTVTPAAASAASSATAPTVVLGSITITPSAAGAASSANLGALLNAVLLTPAAATAASSASIGGAFVTGAAVALSFSERIVNVTLPRKRRAFVAPPKQSTMTLPRRR